MLRLWLILVFGLLAFTAKADYISYGGSMYVGRLESSDGRTLRFNFDCSGNVQTIGFAMEMTVGISGDCTYHAPEPVGGAELCPENIQRDQLFLISYSGVADSFLQIWAFDYFAYDGRNVIWGWGGDNGPASDRMGSIEKFTVTPLPADYCVDERLPN